jgi:hypothetical protein
MKADINLWSYPAHFFLEWKIFQTKIAEKINLQSVSDRIALYVHIVELFYTTVATMKSAHPWPFYRPVHKSGCCEKNTHHAREASSSNVRVKLVKNGVISSDLLSEYSRHILQLRANTISSNKTNRYSKYAVLTCYVWEAIDTATDIKL